MNEAFEKILERLEEERELSYADFSRYVEEISPCLDDEYDDFFHRGLERASRLVKEVAEEYKDGWIPCNERLPEESGMYIVTCKDEKLIHVSFVQYQKTTNSWNLRGKRAYWRVIAWQPLPEPFKESD